MNLKQEIKTSYQVLPPTNISNRDGQIKTSSKSATPQAKLDSQQIHPSEESRLNCHTTCQLTLPQKVTHLLPPKHTNFQTEPKVATQSKAYRFYGQSNPLSVLAQQNLLFQKVKEEREEKFVNFLLSNQGFCEPRKTILGNSFAEIVNLLTTHNEMKQLPQPKNEQLRSMKRKKFHQIESSTSCAPNGEQNPHSILIQDADPRSNKITPGIQREKQHARILSSVVVLNKNSQTQQKINHLNQNMWNDFTIRQTGKDIVFAQDPYLHTVTLTAQASSLNQNNGHQKANDIKKTDEDELALSLDDEITNSNTNVLIVKNRPSSMQSRKLKQLHRNQQEENKTAITRKQSVKEQVGMGTIDSQICVDEIKLTKILIDKPAPLLSAQSWVVVDQKTQEILFGRLERDRREVASLTKLMTLYTVFRLCDSLKIDMKEEMIVVDEDTVQVSGTTANLKLGDTLSVDQLLYGMMLPSGNDASFALAQHFGRILVSINKQIDQENQQQFDIDNNDESTAISENTETKQNFFKNQPELMKTVMSPVSYDKQLPFLNQLRSKNDPFLIKKSQFRNLTDVCAFLSEMNKNCARLNLRATMFDSPHGLMNPVSRSTAYDIAKLAAICMGDSRFLTVVNQKYYTVSRTTQNSNKRTYRWENTHRMLGQTGITAIKTGVTNTAGPCLATAANFDNSDSSIVIVLLCCKDMDCRWLETYKLAKWATNRLVKIRKFGQENLGKDTINTKLLERIKHL